MRKILYLLVICLFLISCDKEVTLVQPNDEIVKRILNNSEIILKDNLQTTAKLVANILQDRMVIDELKAISSKERLAYSLSFKDLLDIPVKGTNFKVLREKFIDACAAKGLTDEGINLTEYLVENNCYLYCPYPDDFYPGGISNFTVAGHPIDNEEEGVGFVFDSEGNLIESTVNEEYTDENPVLLIMPNDNDQIGDPNVNETLELNQTKEAINEVRIGYIRCASYCGGLFEGTLELRVGRGLPSFNSETEVLTGTFTTVIPINYPRDYAKAARNGWTVSCNGGWYPVNIVWDSNWKVEEVQQGVLAYEYDQTTAVEVSATVGYKQDEFSGTQTAKATTTYRGDFLGINEWDRGWFYATNTNPGPGDILKYGWVARFTSTVLCFTTPARTL